MAVMPTRVIVYETVIAIIITKVIMNKTVITDR